MRRWASHRSPVFLDAFQADASPRVPKAAGSRVWVQPSSFQKAGQVQGEPPGFPASLPPGLLRAQPELLLPAGSAGRAPAGCVASGGSSARGLQSADRAGEQRGDGAAGAASVQQAPRIPPFQASGPAV